MKRIITWFKQATCKHNYVEVPPSEIKRKWLQESARELGEGKIESFTYTSEGKCTKCNKSTYYLETYM